MRKRIFLIICLLVFVVATGAEAAVFNVTPASDNDCSDFECDLQSALMAAESNGEDDTINLAAGTYNVLTTLSYRPWSENYSLTIVGAGEGLTIVQGKLGGRP